MDQQPDKITDAVKRCVDYVLAGDHPFRRAADFIDSLKVEDGWSNRDVDQVRSEVLFEWAKRRHPSGQ